MQHYNYHPPSHPDRLAICVTPSLTTPILFCLPWSKSCTLAVVENNRSTDAEVAGTASTKLGTGTKFGETVSGYVSMQFIIGTKESSSIELPSVPFCQLQIPHLSLLSNHYESIFKQI
jgi:hypothetical protein